MSASNAGTTAILYIHTLSASNAGTTAILYIYIYRYTRCQPAMLARHLYYIYIYTLSASNAGTTTFTVKLNCQPVKLARQCRRVKLNYQPVGSAILFFSARFCCSLSSLCPQACDGTRSAPPWSCMQICMVHQ